MKFGPGGARLLEPRGSSSIGTILGFTWYSLTDQVDWDSTLRENAGRVDALGLYDLDRRLRPIGAAFRRLVTLWRDIVASDARLLSLGY